MPLSQELKKYLQSSPFDKSCCHIVGPHIKDTPTLFFVLSSASSQGLHPEKEKLASEFIRQLSEEAGLEHVFTDHIETDSSVGKIDASEADALLIAGNLNAVQNAQFISSKPLTVISLDEKQDYVNYLNILKQWNASKEKVQKALSLINGALKRTVVLANKTIQALLIRREAYRGGRTPLGEYIRNLVQQAQSLGIQLKATPTLLKFHKLAMKELDIDVEQAKQEIEMFADKLIRALGEKELWLRQTIEALSSAQPGKTQELEAQLQFLTDYLSNTFTIQELKESLFFRTAMYGAYEEGFDELEKPREMASRGRREKAFISGVLQGPTHILMLLVKKLLAADSSQETVVPETYDFILDVGIFTGFEEADMPQLIEYVQYGNRYKALTTARLLKETERLEQQILKQAAASDQDREVVAIHTTFATLRERVLLQLEWSKRAQYYAKESSQDNAAGKLKQFPLLQNILKKEMLVVLDALNDAESLARTYYQRLERRSQIMAAKLRAELSAQQVDRAVVYVDEYTCKTLVALLEQIAPESSYIILVPFVGNARQQEPDFSRFQIHPKDQLGEFDIAFYRNYKEDLGAFPRKHCENSLCRFSGPAIYDRVVCLTQPGLQAVFYCNICNKHYCGLELKPLYLSEQDFERIFSFDPLHLMEPIEGKPPFTLQCRHCGNLVGKGKKTIVWNIDR